MKSEYLFCLFCLAISFNTKSQTNNHHLEFTLHNKHFDSLRIATASLLENKNRIFVYGNSIDAYTWQFELPDSIWPDITHFVLGNANKSKRVYEYIQFSYKLGENNPASSRMFEYGWVWGSNIVVPDWTDMKIEANYLNTDTVYEDDVTLIYHNFETNYSGANVKASSKYDRFGSFTSEQNKDSLKTYESYLSEYENAVKEYPDSRFLLIEMWRNINKYHKSEDAGAVYRHFSERNKKSPYGQKIDSLLGEIGNTFENIALRNILNDEKEYIIQDSTRYNLLCFTASWCAPCRREIPLLKKIYSDLKDKSFEIIYISIDDTLSISTFKKQTTNDSIPWRTLYAYPFVKNIMQRYVFSGIPTHILVYPDNRIEFVDIQKELERNKLYRLSM
jgi:thiol-disulfide isomerase/thioredoxin